MTLECYRQGLQAVHEYDLPRATALAEKLDGARRVELLARVAYAEFDPDQALRLLDDGIKAFPDDGELFEFMGRIHDIAGRTGLAKAAWQAALKRSIRSEASVRFRLARTAFLAKDYAQAVDWIRPIEEFDHPELAEKAAELFARCKKAQRQAYTRVGGQFEVVVHFDFDGQSWTQRFMVAAETAAQAGEVLMDDLELEGLHFDKITLFKREPGLPVGLDRADPPMPAQ